MLKKSILLGTSVLVAASFAASAAAQQDEIIVTATKREQTLQDVPVSVSVTDAETVEQARILDLLDLQSVVPSLRVSQLQNSTQTTFIIRGFGNGANNAGIEPSVAVFVDGVYRSRTVSQISDLPNIERIEVLRGPQSTLFGKNASAGVVSVVTSKPEFERNGYLEATIGNYNARQFKGYFTGPISDTMAFSLGGTYNKRDGTAENIATGNDVNDRDRYGVRGQLLVEPNDWSSYRAVIDYDKIDEICCTVANLVNGPTGLGVFGVGGALVPEDPFSYDVALNFEPTNEGENKGISLESKWSVDAGEITSITALRSSEINREGDVDFTSADIIGSNAQSLEIETFTQELRFAGEAGPVSYLVGGYYFDESLKQTDSIINGTETRPFFDILLQGATTLAPGTPPVLDFTTMEVLLGLTPGTFFAPGNGVREFATQDEESYSLFAQADWELTDRLTATLGISYFNDEKEVSLSQSVTEPIYLANLLTDNGGSLPTNLAFGLFPVFSGGLPATPENIANNPVAFATAQGTAAAIVGGVAGPNGFQFITPTVGLPNAFESNTSNDSNTDFTIRLAYDLNDNINVYGSYATGYKPTSWNLSRDSQPTAADLATLRANGVNTSDNLAGGTRFAGPEEAEVFELGLKATWDKGSVNIAVFDQILEGFQSNAFVGTAFTLTNAEEQSVKGAEIDLTLFPTENLVLGFSGTFLDPVYDTFTNSASGDISGTQPGGIHETSISTSATWNWERGDYTGFVRGDYQYESDVAYTDEGSGLALLVAGTEFDTRSTNTVNASVGISRGNIDATFFARNLFQDEYITTIFPTTAQAGSVNGYPNQPRTYGVTVRANF
ncbi:TonB-dependent receptor [Parvularcula sp. IMCC14364]|uniref:TonB-dependent receptor n=1 Tax=Parvularcula sp. IMCC14364 TaxID=3067902 RepID=UPI002740F990|nr:TonB-dependent receptor [Parvularcula sp. IMCC14364]